MAVYLTNKFTFYPAFFLAPNLTSHLTCLVAHVRVRACPDRVGTIEVMLDSEECSDNKHRRKLSWKSKSVATTYGYVISRTDAWWKAKSVAAET